MTCSTSLLLSFSLLLLLSFSAAQTLTKLAAILSSSGYNSMSLALHSLTSPSPSLTVFSPPDSAFSTSGRPSLNLIRLHLIPSALPLRSLKSLPLGANIPTLLAGHSLTVTTRPGDRHVSLNNVTAAPIFDDGSLVVYGVRSFFFDQISSLGGETASEVLRSQGPTLSPTESEAEPNPEDEGVTWTLFWKKLLPMIGVDIMVVIFIIFLVEAGCKKLERKLRGQ